MTNGTINMFRTFLILTIIVLLTWTTYAQETNNSNLSPIIYRAVSLTATARTGYISVINALDFTEIGRVEVDQPGYIIEVAPSEKRIFMINFAGVSRTKGLSVINFRNGLSKGFKERELFLDTSIAGMKLAPNNLLWVLLPNSQQIAIVDPKTLETKKLVNFGSIARDIVFSPDGKFAYISSQLGKVVIYDVKTESAIIGSSTIPINVIDFQRGGELIVSADGKTLYAGSENTISILNAQSLQLIDSITFENKSKFGTFQLGLGTDQNILYITELDGRNLFAYNISEKRFINVFTSPSGGGEIQNIKLSSNKEILHINTFRGRGVIDTKQNELIFFDADLFNVRDSARGIALSGDFSIGQPPALQTTSPEANQQVMAGQATTIKWQTTVAAQSFSIASHTVEVSIDGGATFAVIAGAERLSPTTQEFIWQVPDIEALNKAQIRVSTVDLGAKRANSTTGNFSIIKNGGQTGDTQAPTVTFLSPKGGERFSSGDNLQISWMSSDNVAVTSQDLSLSTDGGNTFATTLASGLPGTTQSFSFPIPMTLQSEQTRLRLVVRDAAGNTAQTATPSNFAIGLAADTTAPVVVISQPTPNQSLIAGQPIQVKWQSTDNRAVVNQALLLSLDAGKTFTSIASFGAADNSFVINNIAQLAMANSQVVVRITATDSSGNIGQANAQFSLTPAITNATYQSKVLNLVGIGFMSSSSSSTSSSAKLFINDKEITLTPTTLSNTSFSLKGNKKKLGIVRGNNTVRLVVDGIASNATTFSF